MRRAALLAVCALGTITACGGDSTSPNTDATILIEQDVTVAANGGVVEVKFNATAGQKIRITLTASSNTVGGTVAGLQPYGFLTAPSGADGYNPPLETAQNRTNQVDLTLTETGQYKLAVFDGSGAGANVHVKVQIIS
jgi:hypothetical protein